MRKIQILICLSLFVFSCKTSEKTIAATNTESTVQVKDSIKSIHENPKLVVGIVVDQMRYDYLTRFWDRFGDDGFRRLISEGYNCKNNHFNYAPTKTGPGHASVFTGTSPKNHGIIGNDWYNKFEKQMVYCAGDTNVEPLGTTSNAGKNVTSPNGFYQFRRSKPFTYTV